ncbi:hypothetical protein ABIF83_002292 [Bradyrhizobium ottawaense]
MNVLIIAAKEVHQAIRNRWVLAATLLLAGLALSLTFLGSAPTAERRRSHPGRGRRQPVEPDDLSRSAHRASDLP